MPANNHSLPRASWITLAWVSCLMKTQVNPHKHLYTTIFLIHMWLSALISYLPMSMQTLPYQNTDHHRSLLQKFLLELLYFVCISIMCVCVSYVCLVLYRGQKMHQISWIWVMDGCEPSRCCKLNLGPLQDPKYWATSPDPFIILLSLSNHVTTIPLTSPWLTDLWGLSTF